MNSGKSETLKEARKLITPEEISRGVSPFSSQAWLKKKKEIKDRVEKELSEIREMKRKHPSDKIIMVKA